MQLVAIAATSLDGFITQGDKPGTAFTSEADKQWFGEILKSFPIKIFGRKTFDVSRDHILQSVRNDDDDMRVVITHSPESYQQFEKTDRLVFIAEKPAEIIKQIQATSRKDSRIAILGGSEIYSEFLNAGLLDEFWITLEPKLFGSGTQLLSRKSDARLRLMETINLSSSSLLLKYDCKK